MDVEPEPPPADPARMEEPTANPSPQKLHWLQFSLRTLFVGVTLTCVLMGLVYNFIILPAERQKMAVVEIRKLKDAYVWYANPDDKLSWIGDLRYYLPKDYIYTVIEVDFARDANDTTLELVRHLTQLRTLSLYETQVTDAGLVNLRGLTHITNLNLRKTKVTDAGLADLSGLTQLETLDLGGTHVTDAGVVYLNSMTRLHCLVVEETQITDAGIAELKLPNCYLWLMHAQ